MKEYTGRAFESWEEIMEQMEIQAMRKLSNVHVLALKDVVWEEKSKILFLVQDLMDTTV